MRRNVVAAIGLIGLGIMLGVMLVSNFSPDSISSLFAKESKQIGAAQPPIQTNPTIKALNDALAQVSESVNPSVVSISVEAEEKGSAGNFNDQFQEFFRFFGGPAPNEDDGESRKTEQSGSGVIISSNGYIITNNHVVENATKDGITITLYDKRVFKKAKLVGRDPLTDLAVVKIEADDLPPVHFASMDDVKVGDFVLAVGNPLGLNSTITFGIVSAIGRGQLNLMNRDRYSVENFIQTDAAINPGNSGGGLFNLQGSLVGINSAIATRTGTYIGYGFAIPVDLVKAVAEDLIEDGKIDRGYIGVSIKSLDATEAKAVGLDKVNGVLVQEVLKDSPAEKAGIEIGDVILELDGKSVSSSNELQGIIAARKAGDKVKITIWRDGQKSFKTVTLKPRDNKEEVAENDSGQNDDQSNKKEPVSFEKLGFSVAPLTKDQKDAFDVQNGVMITKVERYGAASERGLFTNGVIVKADKQKIDSPSDLKKVFESKKPGEGVMLQVKYKDSYRMVALEIPGSRE